MPRIAEGLHRLGSDLINFYVVEDATGVTIVDAGVPAFYDEVGGCLEQLGHGWDEVKALVLTHAHPDHVGFAERVRREHGVPVHVHAADEELARTLKLRPNAAVLGYLRHPAAWRTLGALARAGPPPRMAIGEVTTFSGGDRLDVPGRPRVIHAPGHSEGCVAFHFEGHQALLVGDVLCSRNPLTGRKGVQVMPAALSADARSGARVGRPARGRRGRGDRLRARRSLARRGRRRARRRARHREDLALLESSLQEDAEVRVGAAVGPTVPAERQPRPSELADTGAAPDLRQPDRDLGADDPARGAVRPACVAVGRPAAGRARTGPARPADAPDDLVVAGPERLGSPPRTPVLVGEARQALLARPPRGSAGAGGAAMVKLWVWLTVLPNRSVDWSSTVCAPFDQPSNGGASTWTTGPAPLSLRIPSTVTVVSSTPAPPSVAVTVAGADGSAGAAKATAGALPSRPIDVRASDALPAASSDRTRSVYWPSGRRTPFAPSPSQATLVSPDSAS